MEEWKIALKKEVIRMAKLYATIESERTEKHQIANKFLDVKLYYGSKDDSKLLCHIIVEPTDNKPKFFQYNTVEPSPMIVQPKPLVVKWA